MRRRCLATNLDSGNVGILRDVLVLVERILGDLAFLLLDRELDQKDHDWFKRRDGDISRSLRCDVLVKQGQGRRGLVDPDELVSPLQDILGLLMRWGRLQRGQSRGDGELEALIREEGQ